jgi:TolB-like protein
MSFFGELGRRNVFRVAIAYAIVAWLVVQVADIVFETIGAPAWVMQALMLGLVLGFFVALIFSWAYEVTPEGVKRESEIDRSKSITGVTGRKLDRVITGLLVLALGYFIWESRVADPDPAPVAATTEESQPIEETETPVSDLSIAVLPFDNRSNLAEDAFFVDGMHDDLLTTLAKIGSMKVISRTSVMEYRGGSKKIPEIAEELGVANILEGGVQRAGNQVRINVQLIDADTDEHLWAEIYDRELTAENLFAIQSEISKAIADALHATLSPEEERRIAAAPTDNLEAFDHYLRGRQLMATREVDELEASTHEFLKAVELDPEFALAWVGVADSHNLLASYADLPEGTFYDIRDEAINRALTVDPLLGEAFASLGSLLADKYEAEAAEEAYRSAVQYSPNYATGWHWLANAVRFNTLRAREALSYSLRAAELDPNSAIILSNLAGNYRQLGDFEAGDRYNRQLLRLHPDFANGLRGLVFERQRDGDIVGAVEVQRRLVELDSGSAFENFQLAVNLAIPGAVEEARTIAQSMGEHFPDHALTQLAGLAVDLASGDEQDVRSILSSVLSDDIGITPRYIAADIALFLAELDVAFEVYDLLAEGDFSGANYRDDFLGTWEGRLCYVAYSMLGSDGNEEHGRELLRASVDLYENSLVDLLHHPESRDLDLCYLLTGEHNKALDIIELQLENNFVFIWRWQHAMQPYDAIREHPRYVAAWTEFERRMAEQLAELRKKDRPAFAF